MFTWSTSLGLTNDPLLSLSSTCKVINNKVKLQSFMYEPKWPLSSLMLGWGCGCDLQWWLQFAPVGLDLLFDSLFAIGGFYYHWWAVWLLGTGWYMLLTGGALRWYTSGGMCQWWAASVDIVVVVLVVPTTVTPRHHCHYAMSYHTVIGIW